MTLEERVSRLERWANLDQAGAYLPAQCSAAVNVAIVRLCQKYRMPRWFLYSLIERENVWFNPLQVNPLDRGAGLVQLTHVKDLGMPFPENLQVPHDDFPQYGYDQGFSVNGFPRYGKWIRMTKVSRLDQPFDVGQNLERFFTGYAVAAFALFKRWYGLDNNDTLRALAWHWNQGPLRVYNPASQQYLPLYDEYVAKHRPPCEAEDGVWDGVPATL